jgi:hypothetical protein
VEEFGVVTTDTTNPAVSVRIPKMGKSVDL